MQFILINTSLKLCWGAVQQRDLVSHCKAGLRFVRIFTSTVTYFLQYSKSVIKLSLKFSDKCFIYLIWQGKFKKITGFY